MKILRILVLVFSMVSLLANSQSKASPTDINFPPVVYLPDLTGQLVDLGYSYNAGTKIGTLSADGLTTDYNISDGHGGITDIVLQDPDTYALSATINNSGATPVLTGGTLSISGDIGDGHGDTFLLIATLVTGAPGTAFGYGDLGNDEFQFKFAPTGGTLKSAFGGNTAVGGITLEAFFSGSSDPFTGSWVSNFGNTGTGDMDSFAMIPEPSSIVLVLVGSILLVGGYRCRRSALRV